MGEAVIVSHYQHFAKSYFDSTDSHREQGVASAGCRFQHLNMIAIRMTDQVERRGFYEHRLSSNRYYGNG